MNGLIKIALLIVLLAPQLALAQRHHDRGYDSNRHISTSHSRAKQGWDVKFRKARRSSNCHYYSIYAEGGRGSARLMSLPGKNYIQVTDGQKEGYVCFALPTTLELGKLSNPHVYVELYIEDIGTYYFDSGDRGSRTINNWHRSYNRL